MSGLKSTFLMLACFCISISEGQHLGPPIRDQVTTTRQQGETTAITARGVTGDGQTGNGNAAPTAHSGAPSNPSTQSASKPGVSNGGQIVNGIGPSTVKGADQLNGSIKSPTAPSGNSNTQHNAGNSGKIVVYNAALLVFSAGIMISKQFLY